MTDVDDLVKPGLHVDFQRRRPRRGRAVSVTADHARRALLDRPYDELGVPTRVEGIGGSRLSAAGDARQHALDHPGSSPEHEGLFPAWVAEAARTNTDALAELAEHGPIRPDEVSQRWISVVFLQGDEADAVLDLLDRDGPDAAIEYLKGWDYGDETTEVALESGYVYDDQPPASGTDQTVTAAGYAVTCNHALGHVGLYRQFDTPPDPALFVDPPAPDTASIRTELSRGAQQAASAHGVREARRAALGADRDWFAAPSRGSAGSGRGLSL